MKASRIALTLVTFGVIVGCSDVGFQAVPSRTCVDFSNGGDQNCLFTPEGNVYSVTFRTGQVDILFVNDNSKSMYTEQQKMANAFSGFLNNIRDLDYRIAMITTDIDKDQGRLIEFTDEQGGASGEKFLTKNSSNVDSKFRGTIQRQETLSCEVGQGVCPSDDERGIYAANLAIERNEGSWLRGGAHLAVIALADEDQRSGTVFNSSTGQWEGINARYGEVLTAKDRPETLVSDFTRWFPSKTMSFHSVIVIPGDNFCLNSQTEYLNGSSYALRGSFGNLYSQLSGARANGLDDLGQIVDGSVASICLNTYFNQLNLIGSMASANANRHSIQMQCLPELDDIQVEASQSIDYYVDQSNNKIIFQNLPFGVSVTATWICPNYI